MKDFKMVEDQEIVNRLSAQRDDIYEAVVDQFRVLMALSLIHI